MLDQDKAPGLSAAAARNVSVFICYRRNDGAAHADWADRALDGWTYIDGRGAPCRISTYFDRTAPGVEDWKQHHFPSLQAAHALLVICTPGISKDLTRPDHPDWVYEELGWWVRHREHPPIVVDTTGEGVRWVPELISQRWPGLNLLSLDSTEAGPAAQPDARYLEVWRKQVVNTIRESEQATSHETVRRLQRQATGLRIMLGVALAMLIVAGGSWWQAKQSDEASRQAVGFIRDLFAQADPDKTYGESLTAGQLLRAGTAEIDRQDLGPRVKWRVLQAMGAAYTGLGEKELSVKLLKQSAELAKDLSLLPEDRYQLEFALGEALLAREDFDAALLHLEEARRLADSIHPTAHADRSAVLVALGDAGDPQDARKLYDAALAMDSALHEHADIARDHNRIGALEFDAGNDAAAKQQFESAMQVAMQAPEDARDLLAAQLGNDYAATFYRAGQFDVAYPRFEDARAKFLAVYGRDSGEVADVENNMARILIERDQAEKARPLLEHAVEIQEKFGTEFRSLAFSLNNLALVDMIQNRPEARHRFQRAAAIAERHKLHIGAQSRIHLAELDLADGKVAEANAQLDEAAAVFQRIPAAASGWRSALLHSARAEVHLQRCQLQDAAALLARSGPILGKQWGAPNVFVRADVRRQELLKMANQKPGTCGQT